MSVRISVVAGGPKLLFAKFAATAGNRKWDNNSIASLHVRHLISYLFDDSHELVTKDIARFHRWNEAIKKMKIRPADGGPCDLENCIVGVQQRGICHVQRLDLTGSHPT